MKHFKDWHRVRANIINEVNPISAAAQGIKNWATRPFNQWYNDPHSILNRPHTYQDAVNKAKKNVPNFANRLGLDRMVASDHDLVEALARIIAAREFGPKDDNDQNPIGGSIQEADLAYVWKALQQPVKKGSPQTIAQTKGINRPRVIINLVPVSNPNSYWNWTTDAREWEKQAASQSFQQQMAPPNTSAPPGTAPATSPTTNLGGVPSPKTPGGATIANDLKVKYRDLENKFNTATSRGDKKRIKQMMDVLDYLHKIYTGRNL